MTIRIFYEKSNPDLPWTLRVNEPGGWAHYPAKEVRIQTHSKTEFDPKGGAQKGFILVEGQIRWEGKVAVLLPDAG